MAPGPGSGFRQVGTEDPVKMALGAGVPKVRKLNSL